MVVVKLEIELKKNLEIFSCQTQRTSETKEGEKVCQKYKNKF